MKQQEHLCLVCQKISYLTRKCRGCGERHWLCYDHWVAASDFLDLVVSSDGRLEFYICPTREVMMAATLEQGN